MSIPIPMRPLELNSAQPGVPILASDGGGKTPFCSSFLVLCDDLFALVTLSKAKALQWRG